MSNGLQIGVAIAGGLVLAAVVAYNTWKTQRNTPRLPDAPDAGAAGAAQQDDLPGGLPGGLADGQRVEPQFLLAARDLAGVDKKSQLDALIDTLAPIALDNAVVSGDMALANMPPTRRVGSKPFALEGHNAASLQWESPQPGQRYQAFQAGVQLANRSGALNEIEFSEFVVKTRAFADAVGGEPEFPDMLAEVARARELDEFASHCDAQISFTLHTQSAAWSPGYVHQHAARLGFVAGAIPGRLVLPASQPGLPAVLALNFDPRAALADDPVESALREISLSLDAPQVRRSEQAFVRMRETAVALAARMEAAIMDDAGRPISADGLDAIGASLEQLYEMLDTRDISAGSPLAQRLFS